MADWKKWYPILAEYNAPVKEIGVKDVDGESSQYRVLPEDLDEWAKTLPKDWPETFSSVMGSVTWDGTGYYLTDVADTLYALEKGREYRGGY